MGFKYKIDIPLDAPERTLAHKEIILSKPFLENLYKDWYAVFIDELIKLPPGKVVELGSGGGFLKELAPSVLSSDLLLLPANDLTFSALEMPFENEGISGLLMLDTFHHLPDAGLFLSEADRVLKNNGKLIMIEPASTLWGRFIYSHFHHEPFDPGGEWQIPSSGPLSGANGALPWIVFIRDKMVFQLKFPHLKIEQITLHTPLRYLLSGGVSFKSLAPDFSYPFFRTLDAFLLFLSKQTAMFMTIKIRKCTTSQVT
jgi:SAM-dependent methyltransferase